MPEHSDGRPDTPRAGGGSRTKRRGRPPGSVSLTPDIERIIIAYVRAGAFMHAAAQAAGISPRTFRDWMSRGLDRPGSRPSTPKLRAFARNVLIAHAEARIGAESRVYKDNPSLWLKYAARSQSDLEGWSDPPQVAVSGDSLEDRLQELDRSNRFEARQVVASRFGCGDACFCEEHEGSVELEYDRLGKGYED